ncbi:interaptin-like isoform X2 [Aricia agestis]|nr:interaptin-like isoform X2 [Aricia agestis]
MVEVQMQHETISGQYQEELRLRPDTLNKVSSCREISEVLQEYSERLKATLSRCKADQAALCEAYRRSGQIVRDMKAQHHQAELTSTGVAVTLEEKVKTMTEHQNQLVQFFAAFKQQSESEINELKSTVKALRAQEQEMVKANNELNKNLHQFKLDIEKRNDTINSLQNDLKQMVSEYNTQRSEARNIIQQKEKELKEQLNKEKELKQALQNQEKYTQSVCDQNNELIDKVVAMEEEHEKAAALIREMKAKVEDASKIYDELKKEVAALLEEKERFVTQIDNKDKNINKYAEEINTLKAQAGEKDNQICNLTTELEQCRQEMMTKIANIEELKNAVNNEVNDSEELKRSFEMYKNTVQAEMQELQSRLENKDKELDSKNQKLEEITADVGTKNTALDEKDAELETKIQELNTKYKELVSTKTELDIIKKQLEAKDQELASKDKELDSKANTIAKLMMELKTGTDVRSKLEMDLDRLRQETNQERELEREKHNKMTKKIEHLEASVKDKEESVTKQMSIIKEMRHEKERLQEKIQGMQNTIDNIQKELTGRPAPPRPADLDDNAVMLTPSKKAVLLSPVKAKRPEFVVPRVEPSLDSLLFNTFSDSSLEGDTLDAAEVNRRFHGISRGIPMSPRPIASLKRHRDVSQPSGGLKLKAPASKQGAISLSQTREENIKNKERRFFKNRNDKKSK